MIWFYVSLSLIGAGIVLAFFAVDRGERSEGFDLATTFSPFVFIIAFVSEVFKGRPTALVSAALLTIGLVGVVVTSGL